MTDFSSDRDPSGDPTGTIPRDFFRNGNGNRREDSFDECSSAVQFEVGFQTFEVSELTQYGFLIDSELPEEDSGHIYHGQLLATGKNPNADLQEMEFRVRKRGEKTAKCTFCNLTLKQKTSLLNLLDTISRPEGESDSLADMSYDQLASGEATSANADSNAGKAENPVGPKKSVKTFAVLALGLGMLAIVGIAAAFMQMQYSLSVTNAALVGNYLPINTRIDGEIAKVFFAEGEEVKQGDLLLQMSNPVIESAAALCQAELEAAQDEVVAYEQQLKDFQAKLDVASERFLLQLGSTRAELIQTEQNLKIASAEVQRITPFVDTGAVTLVEFEQAQSAELAFQAEREAKRAQIKAVELSQRATKQNILIMGDRIDDPRSKIFADLKIAQAEVKRLQVQLLYTKKETKQLDIVAPRDGTIYANYRQAGEYLKPADEALALSFPGPTWAMGQISASQVSKVRPGQVVRVVIPSLKMKTRGIVSAIGHRALYAKGGYTAEFRSGVATDVPIKVTLDDLPTGIPSGTRLDMVVKLEMGIPWLDDYLGNTPPKSTLADSAVPITAKPSLETTLVSEITTPQGHPQP